MFAVLNISKEKSSHQNTSKKIQKGKQRYKVIWKYVTVINKVLHIYIGDIKVYTDNLTKARAVPLAHT